MEFFSLHCRVRVDGFIQIKRWGKCEGSRPFCKRNMKSVICRIFISSAFRVLVLKTRDWCGRDMKNQYIYAWLSFVTVKWRQRCFSNLPI